MKATRAKVLLLCTLGGAGLLPAACGGGGGDTKPASAPAEPTASAPAAETAAPAAAEPTAAASSSAAAAPAPAEPAATPLGQVLLTDSHQIQKILRHGERRSCREARGQRRGRQQRACQRPPRNRHETARRHEARRPDGDSTLKEKQELQADITLQPGKCYSIVGFSKKVKDLDLYLFVPPGILSGQDLSDDNRPVIGGPPQPLCPVSSAPITYKLGIVADSGAGDIAVQLYSKSN